MKKIEENLNELLEVFDGTGVPNNTWVKDKLEETLIAAKNCSMPNVVNRRELLLDFADYSESDKTSQTTDECVDNYLDSIK